MNRRLVSFQCIPVYCKTTNILTLQARYGDELSYNRTATNTLRLYYNESDFRSFFGSSQAKFWKSKGHPFVALTPQECRQIVPEIGKFLLVKDCRLSGLRSGGAQNYSVGQHHTLPRKNMNLPYSIHMY